MNEFHKTVKILQKNLLNFSGTTSDADSGKSIEREIVKRDKKYTELLTNHVSITKTRNKVKECHKWIFFWLVVVACGVVVWIVSKTINGILSSKDYSIIVQSIPVFITALVSCITAIVAIPLAITNFLFNTKEDDNVSNIIKHMQDHDMESMTLLKERFISKKGKKQTGYSESDDD